MDAVIRPAKHLIWIFSGSFHGKKESMIEVEGRQIKLSNLDKVLYPKAGFTKGQVIDYYVRIAPVLLPHLADRRSRLNAIPMAWMGCIFMRKTAPATVPLDENRPRLE